MSVLEQNIIALKNKNPILAKNILNASKGDDYTSLVKAKTGQSIPVFQNGHLMYSKYNPEKEVASLFRSDDEFILFCGIGSGIQVEYFLEKFPDKKCAISDLTLSSFKSLLSIVDITKIINDKRVLVLMPILETDFKSELIENYLPVLDGSLRVVSLRSWSTFYGAYLNDINSEVANALKIIETDFITQANFGRVWLKNILHNLKLMSTFESSRLQFDTKKTALICGAGPSLSKKINYIKSKRNNFVIFASDTSFLPLLHNGINPDIFLSLDPQIFSLSHFDSGLSQNTVGIFDLCSLDILARKFYENGNAILFTASNHPLVQYASNFVPLPFANSTSGTVAIYALDVAHRLGFKSFETAGLDFCYAKGKPYANGTYLHKKTSTTVNKLFPTETFFSELMFRGSVKKITEDDKITYRTAVLDYYKHSATNYNFDGKLWTDKIFLKFPYENFLKALLEDLKNTTENFYPMLPFIAYCKRNKKKYSPAIAFKTVLQYNNNYE